MAAKEFTTETGWLIRIAPWMLGACLAAFGLLAFFNGFAPIRYLICSAGIGVVWFILLALAWRTHHDLLRVFSHVFMLGGHQIVWRQFGDGRHFMQGGILIFAVASSLSILLRGWLLKFVSSSEKAPAT